MYQLLKIFLKFFRKNVFDSFSKTVKMSEILNIARGRKEIAVEKFPSGTYFNRLPKDMIEYLKGFTGPLDCLYMSEIQLSYGTSVRIPTVVCVGKTQDDGEKIIENYFQRKCGRYVRRWSRPGARPYIQKGKVIFVDGKVHLLQPIATCRVKGISTNRGFFTKSTDIKSSKCKGKTSKGLQCKARTKHKSGYCYKHQ